MRSHNVREKPPGHAILYVVPNSEGKESICPIPVPTTPRNTPRKSSSEAVRSSKSCHAFHGIREDYEKITTAEDESAILAKKDSKRKRNPFDAEGDAKSGGDPIKIELSEEIRDPAKSREPSADSAPSSSAGLKPPRISAKSISTDGSEGRDLPEYCEGDLSGDPATGVAGAHLILESGCGDGERCPSSLRNETVSTFLKSLVVSGPGNEVFDAPVKGGFITFTSIGQSQSEKHSYSRVTCIRNLFIDHLHCISNFNLVSFSNNHSA